MKQRHTFTPRIPVGIVFILVAVAASLFLKDFTGPSTTMVQRCIWLLAVMGPGLSGLAGIFLGLPGFLAGFILVLVIALPRVLPDPWNRYFSLLYLAGLFLLPAIIKMRKNKQPQKKNTSTQPTLLTKLLNRDGKLSEMPEDEFFGKDQEDEDDTILATADGQPIILVQQTTNGRFFQLIRSSGRILAYRVGGELRGVDPNLVFLDNKPSRDMEKQGFTIELDDVSSIRFKELASDSPGYDFVAVVKTGKRTYRFAPTKYTTNTDFERFWKKNFPSAVVFDNSRTQASPMGAPNKNRLELLKKIRIAYCVYVGAVSLPWMFLNVPYVLFSVLNLLSAPLGLALYFSFPKELTMDEKAKATDKRLSMLQPVIFSVFAIALRSLLDFNILEWGNLLLIVLIVCILLLVLCLILSHEWKERKSTITGFVLVMIFYSLGAVCQLNCTFDPFPAESTTGTVTDMHISTSSKAPDSYILTIVLSDGTELDLETSPEHYESFQIGDFAEVYTYPGLLGVDYAFVG